MGISRSTFYKLWLPVIGCYLLITLASSLYGDDVAGYMKYPFPWFDKVIHFCEYSVLGMVLSRALSWEEYYNHIKRRWYFYFAMILPLAALTDEIHQHFVPGRDMNFFDWLADVSGAITGAVTMAFILKRRAAAQRKENSDQYFSRSDAVASSFLVFALYCVFILASNILGQRVLIFRDDGNYWHEIWGAIEFLILGLMMSRIYHLIRAPYELVLRDGIILALVGGFVIFVYQGMVYLLQSKTFPVFETGFTYSAILLGAALYRLGFLKLRSSVGTGNCQ